MNSDLETWKKAIKVAATARETISAEMSPMEAANQMQSCIIRHMQEASGYTINQLDWTNE